MQGFVTSVYDLGCFAGAILTIFVGEKLGRKRMLLLFTVIMVSIYHVGWEGFEGLVTLTPIF